eukprot:CAMPEP_0183378162 /NCGR_PEP_ID=MMETSP0164_2-20130417/124771_1 /TAXON_ID=221442 /ORGANISM="Coccolithus pelagicus ssp braarudi, Strain PLY182g" /LENGTH=146 /DNA_ID=CAMNT_0025555707 /DNA_START=42 /DNA_END=479 /DNA_ORIENTATION=-
MNSNYGYNGCESAQLTWQEKSIGRADAAGISSSRQRSLNKARSRAKQLQPHFGKTNRQLWVAVQNRGENDPDQYWVAVGHCVLLRSMLRLAAFLAPTGDAGPVEGHEYTFNSTELRLSSVANGHAPARLGTKCAAPRRLPARTGSW